MSGISSAVRAVQPGSGVVLATIVLALSAVGCSGAAAPDAAAAVSAPKADSARAVPAEPVSFFRSQAAACRAHAKQTRSPQVEAARFIRASLVDSVGDGAYLIRDGFGVRLVVRPADRLVLPESGKDTDVMPAPYRNGCPTDVFKGASG